jgi:hypothetical protein
MVDFDNINDFLDELFVKDEQAKDIISRSGFTTEQLKLINILIVSALRAYDAESRKE